MCSTSRSTNVRACGSSMIYRRQHVIRLKARPFEDSSAGAAVLSIALPLGKSLARRGSIPGIPRPSNALVPPGAGLVPGLRAGADVFQVGVAFGDAQHFGFGFEPVVKSVPVCEASFFK